MDLLIKGIGWGLLIALMAGPVFFAIIQTSLQRHFSQALSMALGVLTSDTLFIGIAYWGVRQIPKDGPVVKVIGIAGGIFVIAFGVYNIYKKAKVQGHNLNMNVQLENLKFYFKGLLMNLLNPSVFLFWIGIVTAELINNSHPPAKAIMFFMGILGTIFLTDIIKINIARRLSRLFNPKTVSIINKIVGILLIIFGIKLLYEGITGFEQYYF